MENKLLELIKSVEKVLITSHISPDPDAVTSVLLLGRTLKTNFPDKNIELVLEEKPTDDLSFLKEYNLINFEPISKSLESFLPDLLIVVDANNYDRISREDGSKIRQYIVENKIKTAIIDHHELDGKDNQDILINNKRPATAEEIYAVFFDALKLKKPGDYAETALLGIISDTQRHRFDHPGYRDTYRVVSQLLDEGASIEKLESRLEKYTKSEMTVFANLASNMTDSERGYSYSYVSDEFLSEWLASHGDFKEMKNAIEQFANRFLRSFESNKWGYIIYPDLTAGRKVWGISFRSQSGIKDVSEVARRLGGGGHKPAAGAKIQAQSVAQALKMVAAAIS